MAGLAGAVLALAAATLGRHHAERSDAEKNRRGARYHAPTRVTAPGWWRAQGTHSPPRSRTDVAFHRAADRPGDADAIMRSLVKRERKNARRLALARAAQLDGWT